MELMIRSGAMINPIHYTVDRPIVWVNKFDITVVETNTLIVRN